ncbi:hypothetical protein [Haladaptatus sp. DFWS20]|uniref:hypothetical protein n=1 Tax=Haladaptatus sp. DFWS20 TaxID=3403467 RepID=UPI003EBAABE0
MNTARTKLVVLALVVLLAFGAPTVDRSLGVLSDSETFDSAEIVGGTETGTSDAGVQPTDSVNETTTKGTSPEKTTTTNETAANGNTTSERGTAERTTEATTRTTGKTTATGSESG